MTRNTQAVDMAISKATNGGTFTMKRKTSFSVVVVLGFALAVLLTTASIVDAENPKPVSAAETQSSLSLLNGLPGAQFVHTATAANINSNWTEIDHPLTNDDPNAIVFVTQNWNPGDSSGQYNDHSIGVWYRSSTGRWAIFNQDIASMPEGADFNVIVFGSKIYLPFVVR
jgi:hypothetical protein